MSWDLQNFQNNDLKIVISITSQYFGVIAILILLALYNTMSANENDIR